MLGQFICRIAGRLDFRSAPVVGWVGRRLVASALCLVVAGCGTGTTASPAPARAEDSQGTFRLVLELPRTDWRASEAITGEATLSLIGSEGVDFGASGSGPIAFSFEEIGGSRHVDGHGTPDCRGYRLEAGKPISSPINKSGVAAPPDFSLWFMTDPLVQLPAGDWTITAIADVWAGICPVPSDRPLRAALRVHVTA